MTTHQLKTWPEYFDAILEGRKQFEYRRNDRNFQVGDFLCLREWKPEGFADDFGERIQGNYTGREIIRRVTYLLLTRDGYAVMSLERENAAGPSQSSFGGDMAMSTTVPLCECGHPRTYHLKLRGQCGNIECPCLEFKKVGRSVIFGDTGK
jgi:hypothetical protein